MDNAKKDISETGIVKMTNKDKKELARTGVKPSERRNPPLAWRPKPGVAPDARTLAHKAKRGVKTKGVFSESLAKMVMEGLVKKMNKNTKNSVMGTSAEDRNKVQTTHTKTKAGEEHAALNMAGASRRAGMKNTAKLFLKASKNKRTGKRECLNPYIINTVTKMITEGIDDDKTDSDSISNAGGDSSTYEKIKASKAKSGVDTKTVDHLASKHNIKPSRKTGKVTRGSFRKEIMGKMGGMKDKQGNPALKPAKVKDNGNKTKPLPLKIKGTPGKGKKVSNVRGKSVHTSRSTGEEGRKADANSSMFNKLVGNLQKSGNKFKKSKND